MFYIQTRSTTEPMLLPSEELKSARLQTKQNKKHTQVFDKIASFYYVKSTTTTTTKIQNVMKQFSSQSSIKLFLAAADRSVYSRSINLTPTVRTKKEAFHTKREREVK